MKKINLLITIICTLLSSCVFNTKFEKAHIEIEEVFNINQNDYYVYFYSDYCYDCITIKNDVELFIDNETISLFLVNLDEVSEESFNKMEIVYAPYFENYDQYLNVTQIENLIFYTAPCIYYFKNDENKTYLKNIYYNLEKIYMLFSEWRGKDG